MLTPNESYNRNLCDKKISLKRICLETRYSSFRIVQRAFTFPLAMTALIKAATHTFNLCTRYPLKLKKTVITQEYKDGGCKMLDIRSQIMTQKLKWIKLYLNCHDCLWRYSMEALINVENVNMFLRSNYDMCNNWTNSKFYNELLSILYKLNLIDQSNSIENLQNQFIFYDKRVKIGKKHVYDGELSEAGLWRFCDLFETDGRVIPFNRWVMRGVSKSKFMTWNGLVSIVKKFQTKMDNHNMNVYNKTIVLPTADIIDIQCSNSKEIYSKIIKLRREKPTTLEYLKVQFSLSDKEVENMYLLPRVCTTNMALKEFQYKILHRYLATNELLYKMKRIESKRCTFCSMYAESIVHIFYDCIEIKQLWYEIQNILERIDNRAYILTSKDIVLGFDLEKNSKDNMFVNNVILQGKLYIWTCRSSNQNPSYNKFKEYLESRKCLEPCIDIFHSSM